MDTQACCLPAMPTASSQKSHIWRHSVIILSHGCAILSTVLERMNVPRSHKITCKSYHTAYLSCDPDRHILSVGFALLCSTFDGSQKHQSPGRHKISGLLVPIAPWICCLQNQYCCYTEQNQTSLQGERLAAEPMIGTLQFVDFVICTQVFNVRNCRSRCSLASASWHAAMQHQRIFLTAITALNLTCGLRSAH